MAAMFAKAANQASFLRLSADPGGPFLQATMTEPLPSDAGPEADIADIEAIAAPVGEYQLSAQLAARMCHDFISPAGAIVSGLDLLEDPSAQDMREDAMNLITASAKKLVALLSFDRVAFGGSAAASARTRPRMSRVWVGSMMPSSQSRAVA